MGQSRNANKGTRMNIIRSEKDDLDFTDANMSAVTEVEAGIRDFVRNDIAYLRRPAPPPGETVHDPSADAAVAGVTSLIQRVAGTSLAEIESLINELEAVRDILHAEGQRVQRDLTGYAQLSQAAMKSTRLIADNVAQWRRAVDDLQNI